MTAQTTTLEGRAAAEALMVDTCTITRGSGTPTFDESTGGYTYGGGTVLYSGKCRVKPAALVARVVEAGEAPVSLWPFSVSVPVSVTGLDVNDLVTVTSSTLDPDLADTVLRVRSVAKGSHITARRLGCEVDRHE